MTRRVLLDSEAVVALPRTSHASHRRVLALMQVVAGRKPRHEPVEVVVPTTVRVQPTVGPHRPGVGLVNLVAQSPMRPWTPRMPTPRR